MGYFASLGPRLVRNVAVAVTALQDETAGWQANGKEMANPELTDRTVRQGHALVRAIDALGTIESTNRLERKLAGLLLY